MASSPHGTSPEGRLQEHTTAVVGMAVAVDQVAEPAVVAAAMEHLLRGAVLDQQTVDLRVDQVVEVAEVGAMTTQMNQAPCWSMALMGLSS